VIGRIAGRLIAKHPPQIVVDVHGVGYEIDVPMSTLYQLPATGADVTLLTHFVVREDAQQLYGFSTEGERTLFRKLLKISGVGARTALSVLSGMSVNDVKQAVSEQDSGRLMKVPGIGKKTAERLLLELKDKLDITIVEVAAEGGSNAASDVVNALLALGYNDKEVQFAVKNLDRGLSVTEGIRQALKLLSRA
jgi:Holliday junction DNA helicase RuvA